MAANTSLHSIEYTSQTWAVEVSSQYFRTVCYKTGGKTPISAHTLLSFYSPSLPSCVWSCLVSKPASGHVSPCVASFVTGDPSPQVEVYYWPDPMGPPILTNQL